MKSESVVEQVASKLKNLNPLFQTLETRLSAASRATQQATSAIQSAGKTVQAVATLLDFDEINRLKEKSSGSSSGSKKGSSGGDKVKTGPTEDYGLAVRLEKPSKTDLQKFWSQFQVGFQDVSGGGESAGRSPR